MTKLQNIELIFCSVCFMIMVLFYIGYLFLVTVFHVKNGHIDRWVKTLCRKNIMDWSYDRSYTISIHCQFSPWHCLKYLIICKSYFKIFLSYKCLDIFTRKPQQSESFGRNLTNPELYVNVRKCQGQTVVKAATSSQPLKK